MVRGLNFEALGVFRVLVLGVVAAARVKTRVFGAASGALAPRAPAAVAHSIARLQAELYCGCQAVARLAHHLVV